MGRILNSRYKQVMAVFLVLMAILAIRLFVITVVQHSQWSEKAVSLSTKTITTSAPRGNIYDRDGEVLATNKQVFNVRMYSSGMEADELNEVSYKLIKLFKKNGDKYEDDFPIKLKNGKLYYEFDREIQNWLKSQDMPVTYTAEQAFNQIRKNLGISDDLDVYEAQLEMQNTYGVYPPVSVGAVMKYTYENEKKTFLERYHIVDKLEEKTGKKDIAVSDISAETAFNMIRESFKINKDVSNRKARNIMIVRDALDELGYTKYLPAVLAKDVSEKTIIEIQENPSEYTNVEIASEYIRFYPSGSFASHILGYMGSISDSEKEEYVEKKGYNTSDLIGKDGIESKYESTLKGNDGSRTVRVDVMGNLVEVISETDPVTGDDVYLTIDKDIQKSVEKNLEKGIKATSTGGAFTSKYGNYVPKASSKCESGAAVVLDVSTGDVLGMASYPDFNPNLFATGISSEDWNSLQSKNTRDPLSAQPLYNIATRSAVQPGSTFKPVTATAALANGLNPNVSLKDGGQVEVGDQTYDCLIYTDYHTTHGYVNLAQAIGVSCNYYFFDIGQGKDYYTGGSLGYKCDVDEILKFAKLYGLGESTGIELTETTTVAPSAESKMKGTEASVRNILWTRSKMYFKKSVLKNETVLTEYINEIAGWTEENPSYEAILDRLPDCGIRESKVSAVADLIKFSYFNQAGWTEGDALNISIGQGENSYTPLQLANYAATIGNKGVRNKVSVVKSVGGQGVKKKEKGTDIGVKKNYFDYLLAGMKNVTTMSGGSLTSLFKDFPVSVAAKTGTAERAGKINTSDEVSYIKSHLSQMTGTISWKQVETEMNRIMKEYPNVYTSRDVAVRQALYNLSNGSINSNVMDRWKGEYENFAWTIAVAPADDPQIAVCVLLVQGKTSLNAGVIAREIIGDYMDISSETKYNNKFDTQTEMN